MRGDRGVGLIELLVVMSLTTLALTMFGMAFSAMLRTSDASRDIGAVTDQARLALNELDRQIRFGYWIKPTTVGCATTCPAIKVLTVDRTGARQCWVWAIDESNGRLLSYHFPASVNRPVPSLTMFGNPGNGGWHLAAGPEETSVSDEVAIDPASDLAVVAGSLVKPLNAATFERASYYLSASATLVIAKPGRPNVTLTFDMSVRNQWVGAQYASECG
ncbi:MAG: PilW family protein [Actinomycetota bacterium]